MKRFWLVLLSLGLIIAFNISVYAADAKFAGEFFLQGWYNKNASLLDKDAGGSNRGSSAFYTERLRVGIDFEVAKGLKLGTRFDALDRKWMAARTSDVTSTPDSATVGNKIGTTYSEKENIGFEIAYVQFFTPIGLFTVGDTISGQFGTPFNDYVGFHNPIIAYTIMKGPWIITPSYKKSQDGADYPAGTAIGGGTDFDTDTYTLQVQNRWSTGSAGGQFSWVRKRTGSPNSETDIPFGVLFFRNQFGKIFVEDEAMIVFGMADFTKWSGALKTAYGLTDVENDWSISNYFNINVDLAPAKIGFMFVYSPGDDPATLDKREGGYHNALGNDKSFNPCLIMFNYDYVRWMGQLLGNQAALAGYNSIAGTPRTVIQTGLDTYFDNVWFYQIYGDFAVNPKLKISANFSYAYADEKPSAAYVSKKYGYELDAMVRYKIYDNLEYMIGAAYLWTGDYFKGTSTATPIEDNYLLTHKLTLTF